MANQTNSPLLRLPGEIRNLIYEYVYPDTTILVKPLSMNYTRCASSNRKCTALVSTCSQTHHEVKPIWYSTATFNLRLSGLTNSELQLGTKSFRRLSSMGISVELAKEIEICYRELVGEGFWRREIIMPEVKRVFVCGRMADQGPVVIAMNAAFQQEDLEVCLIKLMTSTRAVRTGKAKKGREVVL